MNILRLTTVISVDVIDVSCRHRDLLCRWHLPNHPTKTTRVPIRQSSRSTHRLLDDSSVTGKCESPIWQLACWARCGAFGEV